MKRPIVSTFLVLLFVCPAYAQFGLNTVFENGIYPAANTNYLSSHTDSENVLVIGSENGSPPFHNWYRKVSHTGIILMEKYYEPVDADHIYWIQSPQFNSDGFAWISIENEAGFPINPIYLDSVQMLDFNGEVLWKHSFSPIDVARSRHVLLRQFIEGDYLLFGLQSPEGEQDLFNATDGYFVKISPTGQEEWRFVVEGFGNEVIDILPIGTESIAVLRRIEVPISNTMNSNKLELTLIDSSSTVLWQDTIGEEGVGYKGFMERVSAETMVVTYSEYVSVDNAPNQWSTAIKKYIIPNPESLQLEDEENFDQLIGNVEINHVQKTNNGGLLLCGSRNIPSNGSINTHLKAIIQRIDEDLNLVWEQEFDYFPSIGNSHPSHWFREVSEFDDSRITVGGIACRSVLDPDYPEQELAWQLILNEDGCLIENCSPLGEEEFSLLCSLVSDLKVWPNPTSAQLRVEIPEGIKASDIEGVEVRHELGRELIQDSRWKIQDFESGILNVASLSTGMYVIQLVTTEQVYSAKFIKE